jgi:hypothetical protein
MTDNVINLSDYRKAKQQKNTLNKDVKRVFTESIDNSKVMERYNIKQPTIEERTQRIKDSIERVNNLMRELEKSK